MKWIIRAMVHLIFGIRRFNNKCIRGFAEGIENSIILEIGSGKRIGKVYPYSARKYFGESNVFIQSDIIEDFGHDIIDITSNMGNEKYDVIICMNVLEHVYEYSLAITNMYRAIKPGGRLVVFVPYMYPLHDEPNDYWRFSEHALRKMIVPFNILSINYSGLRQFPVAYFIVAKKGL